MRLFMVAVAMTVSFPLMAEPLTIDRIFDGGNLDGAAPRGLKLSPDGTRVTLLRPRPDDRNRFDLWEYHVADGELRRLVDADKLQPGGEKLSAEEEARRERARTAGYSGIVDYQWSPDGKRLLFPLGEKLYLYEPGEARPVRALDTGGAVVDPRISPKGGFVSYVRDQDLWVIDLAGGAPRRLTHDGGGTVHNGEAEFVAQEEMGRTSGYWWAPDDSAIAFQRYDEADVPVVKRFEVYADRTDVIEQRYPAAGDPNVKVRLGLVVPQGGDTRWIDLGQNPDIYLARVDWLPDARRLTYQLQQRDQRRLDLELVDVASLEVKRLLTETRDTWVELNDDLHFLADGKRFIWGSDRSGFHHLYLYGVDGKLRHALTGGEWNVDRLAGVDEKTGSVFLESNRDFVPDRQLYAVSLDGSTFNTPRRITRGDGWHATEFSANGQLYIDTFSNPSTPPQVSLRDADGDRLAWIEENPYDQTHPSWRFRGSRIVPEFGTLEASDGQTLHYRLFKPKNFDPSKRYPVFSFYYGGPGVQKVVRAWGDPASAHGAQQVRFCEYLAQQGYVVFTLDNRGMSRRGRRFSDAIHHELGAVEVEDQLAGIRWLGQQPWVDAQRVGVFGWSYGGYLTTMLLARSGGAIAAGVSVAPVTDWALYDTHYTERYLGKPDANRAGYIRSAPFAWLDGFNAPMLLVHGMADDNVLFTNSTKLMAALQDRGVAFDLMTYPGGKHGLSTPAMRKHVYHAIEAFLDRHLKAPPAPETPTP
ncbi:S9 family peptidase [Dokdonella sp. MW10]|uniref:S9 family peptidase n=1 Tax=Dokdonella sp. MW10 TaxID=2992926 RepID=UPI003F7D429D